MNYRKIYENALKEKIPKDFDIHHIDLNHKNNDIKNLVAIPKTLHQKFHKYVNEMEQIRNDFKFEDLYKIGGNYDFTWNAITGCMLEYLRVANEIHKYIVKKEIKLLNIR